MCPVQSGALSFRVKVSGRAIHACMKPHGVSAIEKFYLVLQSVQELERRRHVEYKNALYEDPNEYLPVKFRNASRWRLAIDGSRRTRRGRPLRRIARRENTDTARTAMATAISKAAASDSWLKDHPPQLEWFEGQFESGQTPLDSGQ